MNNHCDVLIIGAGPAGSIAGALLRKKGYSVIILEAQQFPRFSIGESLLPFCMSILEEADMLSAVNEADFQIKNGAVFLRRDQKAVFDFREKFSEGPSTTFQVQRAQFDKILADESQSQGVEILYNTRLVSLEFTDEHVFATAERVVTSEQIQFKSSFILDASGFGRVLPKLLSLDEPSDFPPRGSLFCHIKDDFAKHVFDREKILVSVHPTHSDIWFWTIPFANGISSLGVVGEVDAILPSEGMTNEKRLFELCNQVEALKQLLVGSKPINEVRAISNYASKVKALHGHRFALLGNAGEFLDPVFSSGVTIAMKSAQLSVKVLDRYLRNEEVDWKAEFEDPLMKGIDSFRAFVESWYDESLQQIIFHPQPVTSIKEKICSVLAGYAWDSENTYNSNSKKKLDALAILCV